MKSKELANRYEAGKLLGAAMLEAGQLASDSLILGLVRGGAQIACGIAHAAQLPWDIFIVRKIGAPQQPEYALGAFAETGRYVLNNRVLRELGLGSEWIEQSLRNAHAACQLLSTELRGSETLPQLTGRNVVLADDGIATGFTMEAAADAASSSGALQVTVATPVIAPDTAARFKKLGISTVALDMPRGFRAVGQYYRDFSQVTSDDVRRLLAARDSA